jgi:hypothetical protein
MVDALTEGMVKKINNLIENKPCFKVEHADKVAFVHSSPATGNGHPLRSRHGKGNGGFHGHVMHGGRGNIGANYHSTRPPRIFGECLSGEMRLMKELVGNLNKINKANFGKMSLQIQKYFFMDLDKCMSILLDRCHIQNEFMPTFIRLMDDLMQAASPMDRANMQKDVDLFVSSFLNDKTYIKIGRMAGSDYNEYCEWVTRKKVTIGKHRTVLMMVAEGITDETDLHSYFCMLIEVLYTWGNDTNRDIEVIELVLDMIGEFFRLKDQAKKKFVGEWKNAIFDAYNDEELSSVLSIKCRFKLLNLIENRSR